MTSLLFDSVHNLLWCGDSRGLARSFTPNAGYPFQVYPYTKFAATTLAQPVVQQRSHVRGVLSLLQNCVNLNSRRGVPQASFTAESVTAPAGIFGGLSCMSTPGTGNDVVLGGTHSLFSLDMQKSVVSPYDHRGKLSFVDSVSKTLVLGATDGTIELFDTTSNSSVKAFQAHNGLLGDMAVQGNYIATCGYSARRRYDGPGASSHRNSSAAGGTSYITDPLVHLIDTRMMKPLLPIPFPNGAAFVRFHPKLPNIVIVASSSGVLEFVDIFDQLKLNVYQVNTAPASPGVSRMEISDNGEYICCSEGRLLHLWSFTSDTNFVNFPAPLEEQDIPAPLPPPFEVDDPVPLSSVGMPYYKDYLLSNYATDLVFTKELLKVPAEVDTSLGHGAFVPYDRTAHGPRNISQPYQSLREPPGTSNNAPRFISERDGESNENMIHAENSVFHLKSQASVPNCYSRLQIQYSKFGVDDFDFDYYNKSNGECSGLENHLDNSYTNALLQLYRAAPAFYNSVVESLLPEYLPNGPDIILWNPQGLSLLIELGYLFDMMHKAEGRNVKIANFSQLLTQSASAASAGVINTDEEKSLNADGLREIIIRFNHYLLSELTSSQRKRSPTNSEKIEDIMGIRLEMQIKSQCAETETHTGSQLIFDLASPPEQYLNKLAMLRRAEKSDINILSYMDYFMDQYKLASCRECEARGRPHAVNARQRVVRLPKVLLINLSMTNFELQMIHNCREWLVPEFYIGEDERFVDAGKGRKYELLGYVCEISHGPGVKRGAHNLVSFVKIKRQWYLFNDFLVMPIAQEEALNLSYSWKKPVIIVYIEPGQEFLYFETSTFKKLQDLDTSIIYRDHFVRAAREGHRQEYKLLTKEEAPEMGTLIAIDAEFIVSEPEQLEIGYTGTRKLIKPKKLTLARVSVLRGNGPNVGVPFIDDYIVWTGHIEDYLTSFSGIEPGDLDPEVSKKGLVTLQTVYRKLWLLLNMGCVFVGHGLQNDFRCINLVVPKPQVRDTAHLFYLPEFKRKLSLKFLAYVLLKEKVQTGNHDSVEDAYTALMLFQKHEELTRSGDLESVLYQVYMEGQQRRFRAP